MSSRKNLVKVSNLPQQIDENTIKEIFSYIGQVKHVKLITTLPDIGTKEAYVNFTTLEAAELSTHLSDSELGLGKIKIILIEDKNMATSTIEKLFPSTASSSIISASYYANPQGHIGGPIAVPNTQIGSAFSMLPGYAASLMSSVANYTIPLANPSVVAKMTATPRKLEIIPDTIKSVIDSAILMHDPIKAEEIARTVYIGNISSQISDQELMDFFSCAGDVAYVKMAGDGMQPTRFAFIEFSTIAASQTAMGMSGVVLAGRPLKINFSKNAINKPPRPGVPMVTSVDYTKNLLNGQQTSSNSTAANDSANSANIEEGAMKKLRDAQNKLLMKYSSSRTGMDDQSLRSKSNSSSYSRNKERSREPDIRRRLYLSRLVTILKNRGFDTCTKAPKFRSHTIDSKEVASFIGEVNQELNVVLLKTFDTKVTPESEFL
ncbi:hypothetical protein BB561_005231 [Smittium simulii]|uniref:RRM domain-containing protein n=1 Tax=Smittium simulii TaxID=133385 RepID=A0A2T9YBE1_9FUNG|nr:hypothetical protein BB561_005231 [Smittium simulii]